MSFVKDSIRSIIVRFSSVGFNLVSMIVTARWLGPELIGIFTIFTLIPIFTFRVCNLGLGSSFSFYIARKEIEPGKIVKIALLFSLVLSSIMAAFVGATWRWSALPWNDLSYDIFILCLPTILSSLLILYSQRILAGLMKISLVNISEILKISTNLIFILFFLLIFDLKLKGAIFAYILSDMISMIFLLGCFRKVKYPKLNRNELTNLGIFKKLFGYGLWNYFLMLSNFWQGRLPIFFLKYFFDNTVVGFYSIGSSAMNKSQILSQSMSNVLFPYTASDSEETATKRTNVLCRNLIVFMIAVALFMAIFIKWLILLVFGKEFLPSVPVFIGLLPSLVIFPFNQFLSIHIAARGRSMLSFFVSLITLICLIPCCAVLVPRFGAQGAAWSVSIGAMVGALAYLYTYQKLTSAKVGDVIFIKGSDLQFLKKSISRKFKRKNIE